MSIVAWRVSTYDRSPIRKEFARETNAFYIGVDRYGRERKEKKESSWWRYFADEQEALSFIAARDAAKESRARDDRAKRLLIAAAPDLLAIAERWAAIDGGSWNVDRHAAEKAELVADTAAVIAKATGEQP